MAKKVVASFRDKAKLIQMAKVIRAVKKPETGNYAFKEDIMTSEAAQELLKNFK